SGTASCAIYSLSLHDALPILLLWDDPNPWRDAWTRVALGQALVPVIVPLADAADLVGISAEQAAAGERERLSAMARRYGAVASLDRKSTRLNSSHVKISYAVF